MFSHVRGVCRMACAAARQGGPVPAGVRAYSTAARADPYKVLGISKSAGQDEVKRAYRKLAKKWHPDLNADNREEASRKFKEIAEAYQCIDTPEKRKQFDMFGGASPFGGAGGMGGMQGVDPMEIFRQAFGGQDMNKVFAELEKAVKSGKVQGGGPGGPGAFYTLNMNDIFGGAAGAGGAGGNPFANMAGMAGGNPFANMAAGGGPGGNPFAGGANPFAGMGGGGCPRAAAAAGGGGPGGAPGTQTIQQVVMKPDGTRTMRTTTITFENGKPKQTVTETALPS